MREPQQDRDPHQGSNQIASRRSDRFALFGRVPCRCGSSPDAAASTIWSRELCLCFPGIHACVGDAMVAVGREPSGVTGVWCESPRRL